MISDWNTVILSKIKSILSKLDKSNVAVENISTNISSMENSVSEVLNRIGLTGDTGGSQTAGTVFGKENAIMQMLKDYDGKVKNNMILKKTPTKTFKVQNEVLNFDFDFGKPVRIIGIHLNFSPILQSSSYPQRNFPTYIINGEDSFRTMFATNNSAFGIFCRVNGGGVGFYGSFANLDPIPDIWATRLTLQFSPSYANEGTNVSCYVVYQEEG